MTEQLNTDYLVIGAGAVAMAFVDEIISSSKTARIIMLDRRATPGGHWNNAYRFVTLHQPALYYGVNSEPLEEGDNDLASGEQIVAYYARVLDKLCATGRVQFFGACEYRGEGRFVSLKEDGTEYQVTVHRRTVDATDSNVTVPSTRPPEYAVAEGMNVVPVNALADLHKAWARYVVIGAGKTGIDALLRLLEVGTDPDKISWIVSHDVWYINRDGMHPKILGKVFPKQLRETSESSDVADYFRRFEEAGWMMVLDPDFPPTHFRCTTVNPRELEALRRIQDVVRLGRVKRIEPTEVVLDRGTIPTSTGTLHVDCTANGLARRPVRPVFNGPNILLQNVMFCQPTMSAALIGHIETRNISDVRKNAMAGPCPHPIVPQDYFRTVDAMGKNMRAWSPLEHLWFIRKRLSAVSHCPFWMRIRLIVGMIRWFNGSLRKVEEFIHEYERDKKTAATQ